jgi:hypothetical protein
MDNGEAKYRRSGNFRVVKLHVKIFHGVKFSWLHVTTKIKRVKILTLRTRARHSI